MNFADKRAIIIGLAREGIALARFLARRGAWVTVSDLKKAEELRENIAALEGLPIRYVLGGHPLEILDDADLLFISPGVPLEAPIVAEAERRDIPISSEARLFVELCPTPIVGITGSSGKTTTVTLVGEILKADGMKTWVGGNIGEPLIGVVEGIEPDDRVVLELSSFQLEYFAPQPKARPPKGWERLALGYSPRIAAVLNITPNHLDRHPSMAAYIEAKSHIYQHQRPGDVTVLGWDNPITRSRISDCKSRILLFSLETEVEEGAFPRGGQVVLRISGHEEEVCGVDEIRLRGQHNVANVLAACAIAGAAGASPEAMREAISGFEGVPHRLELVRELRGVRYYNDSIATSPERACAALRSFETPIVLLAGGRDKHLPWDEFAELALGRTRHVICFGEAAELIAHELQVASCNLQLVTSLEDAVEAASSVAQPGDVVLLSPGCTSFDAFRDFEERGERFRELVRSLG
ncbi:MAG: UDP-N-acetylmuramoyl-L-alanine--D-glutamate ligase [Chloroflexota bacterium]|nr:UDP-N-acetylmuramoyl-L-alanine--D-glutamate ligase [Chloroflexota bacterium]